jgi:hypothetical protein
LEEFQFRKWKGIIKKHDGKVSSIREAVIAKFSTANATVLLSIIALLLSIPLDIGPFVVGNGIN